MIIDSLSFPSPGNSFPIKSLDFCFVMFWLSKVYVSCLGVEESIVVTVFAIMVHVHLGRAVV